MSDHGQATGTPAEETPDQLVTQVTEEQVLVAEILPDQPSVAEKPKKKRRFSWRYVTAVAVFAAAVAVAVTTSVLVLLVYSGNPPFAGQVDATVLALLIGLLLTPFLSCLVAFVIAIFTSKQHQFVNAFVAAVMSLFFVVAFGVPAWVISIVLTAP